MARRTDRTDNDAPAPEPRERVLAKYHVARVERTAEGGIPEPGTPLRPGDLLHVIAVDVEGKTGLHAADDAVNALPQNDRTGEFGAFTARNFASDGWETETLVVTRRKSQA